MLGKLSPFFYRQKPFKDVKTGQGLAVHPNAKQELYDVGTASENIRFRVGA